MVLSPLSIRAKRGLDTMDRVRTHLDLVQLLHSSSPLMQGPRATPLDIHLQLVDTSLRQEHMGDTSHHLRTRIRRMQGTTQGPHRRHGVVQLRIRLVCTVRLLPGIMARRRHCLLLLDIRACPLERRCRAERVIVDMQRFISAQGEGGLAKEGWIDRLFAFYALFLIMVLSS